MSQPGALHDRRWHACMRAHESSGPGHGHVVRTSTSATSGRGDGEMSCSVSFAGYRRRPDCACCAKCVQVCGGRGVCEGGRGPAVMVPVAGSGTPLPLPLPLPRLCACMLLACPAVPSVFPSTHSSALDHYVQRHANRTAHVRRQANGRMAPSLRAKRTREAAGRRAGLTVLARFISSL